MATYLFLMQAEYLENWEVGGVGMRPLCGNEAAVWERGCCVKLLCGNEATVWE